MGGPGPYILLCTIAVAALLAAERRHSQGGKWLAKPVASAAFVATALASGALGTRYGQWILAGLLLCLLGDVLLIPVRRPRVFRAGILAFLAGHAAFVIAFLTQSINVPWFAGAAVALGAALWLVWRWLAGSVTADLRTAVQAYFVVIGAMTSLAIGFAAADGPVTVALGAVAFAASDVSVARDRFVREDFLNRAWGLPLYYGGQLLIALSPAAVT
jgi:uncharacterized membrane protein YhhN